MINFYSKSLQSLQATCSYHYNPNIVTGGLKAWKSVNSVTVRTLKGHTSKCSAVALASALSHYEKGFLNTKQTLLCFFSYFQKVNNIKIRISFTQGIPKESYPKRNNYLRIQFVKSLITK